ncbi:MAG: DUF6242 domain-containing protein [Prevotella sp.]|jgi:hypothetical protein
MINRFSVIILMALSVFSLTSCLSSDDDEITYYNDTAITSFTLGTLNRKLTTTASDGSDSTYTTTYSGSSTVFYINQIDHTVYNPDSLPQGVDASKVVCTIGTKNGGVVVLVLKNQAGEDSLAYYSSSDSIDFTSPVTARVYNNYGTEYSTYTIHVNVHQQTGDEISWGYTSNDELAEVGNRRLVSLGDTVFLFGVKDDATVIYQMNSSTWTSLSSNINLDADAYKNVVTKDGYLYVLSDGVIYRSSDGATWESTGTASALNQLIGGSPLRLYALGTAGIYYSSDNGTTWTLDSLDDETSLLPSDNINFVCKKHRVNEDTYKLILIGSSDGSTVVWSKLEQEDEAAEEQPWSYYTVDRTYGVLPDWTYLQAIAYNDGLLALGGDFSTFYDSEDEGLVWTSDSIYDLPTEFGLTESEFGMTSTEGHVIYISKANDSKVWSGQLARTAWATEQQSFVK